ncbi:MAG: hypothetical protein A2Z72_07755 [Omnitrophica bacterium RBG_13_46_9]|nr:MAG: hypothetical protein A2Z72_07755 [Omnitrophica bacterium RBG_13_46_9]
MILAADIGNTNINAAIIDKYGAIRRRFSTLTVKTDIGPLCKKVREAGEVEKIIIVSVVPEALSKVRHELGKNFRRTPILIVGENIRVPLKCEYNKRQIGQDRLITAFAAKSFYGLPVLIIDFGTAVTFDAVSRKGVYLGGLILPGIKMSLESLYERTALLPRTYLKKTRSFIGKDTASSIRNGMIYGYSAICEKLIELFRKRIGIDIKVIATGGDAPLIGYYARSMRKSDPDLSLKGLYLLSKTF